MNPRTGLRAALAADGRRFYTVDGYAVYPLREFPTSVTPPTAGHALALRIRNPSRKPGRAGEATILCQDEPDVDHGRSCWSADFAPMVPDSVVLAAVTAALARPGAL